jgi:hypothetical protein
LLAHNIDILRHVFVLLLIIIYCWCCVDVNEREQYCVADVLCTLIHLL